MKTEWMEKWAKLLVHYSLDIKKGSVIKLRGPVAAEGLIKCIYKELLRAGAFPRLSVQLPGMSEIFYKNADKQHLSTLSPIDLYEAKKLDGIISVAGQANTRELSNIDPAKQVLAMKTAKPLQQIILNKNNWVITLFPTDAHAQDAQMSLADFETFVGKAMFLDKKNPVAEWKKLSKNQQKLANRLTKTNSVRILSNDTDITLSIAGRTGINSDGKRNMPSGEVFTGPVEDSVEGHVCFSYPAIHQGREVEGVRLWFEKGKVVKASAEKNEDFLLQTLDTDDGSRYVGEFAIGTNKGITRFTRAILFDEKINGSFHMAVGAGFPETGSKNQSAIHWDMICDLRDGGEIWVDDELLYKNGEFAIEF